jgi:glycosyltransferase involved in cell wall biosynthesis
MGDGQRIVMRDEHDLSLIICTRNRARQLARMLESVAALSSRYRWEVLVVDNGSTDETAEVIKAADDCGGRLRYVLVERVGLGAARDAAWREARGRLIAFTDDDCYLDPRFVDAVCEVFEEHPEVGCVGGRIMLFDPEDARVTIDEREEPAELAPYRFVDAGVLQGANLSFRRAVLEKIGGVDPELGAGTPFPCEDIDAVAATLWAGYRIRFDPRPVVHHHHGRRGSDVDRLFVGYDRGRGAYYAKYLLRSDTRMAYLRGWGGRIARRHRDRAALRRLSRELAAAGQYIARRNPLFLLAAAPAGLMAWCLVAYRALGPEGGFGRSVTREGAGREATQGP